MLNGNRKTENCWFHGQNPARVHQEGLRLPGWTQGGDGHRPSVCDNRFPCRSHRPPGQPVPLRWRCGPGGGRLFCPQKHSVLPGLLVLGDPSIQGNIKSLRSLAETLQMAIDSGGRRAMIPIENKRGLGKSIVLQGFPGLRFVGIEEELPSSRQVHQNVPTIALGHHAFQDERPQCKGHVPGKQTLFVQRIG